MAIYIVIGLIVLLFSCQKKNKFLFGLVFLLLLLVASFRSYKVGTDTVNYLEIYDTTVESPIAGFILTEPGWVILNLFSKILFNDFRGVLFLSQLIILSFIFLRLWKSSYNPMLGVLFYVLLYFYLHSFNITRQIVAMSIVFYSFPLIFIKNHKYFYYIILACCFHYSAAICLLMPYINKLKFSGLIWSIFLMVSFVSGLALGSMILNILPSIGKYEFYLSNLTTEGGFSFTRLLLNCLFIFLSNRIYANPYLRLCLGGIIIYNIMPTSPAIGRMANYFMIAQLLLFTNFKCFCSSDKKLISGIIILYAIFNFLLLLNANVSEVVPYRFLY